MRPVTPTDQRGVNAAERRRFLLENFDKLQGLSVRQIGTLIAEGLGTDKVPSPSAIQIDLRRVHEMRERDAGSRYAYLLEDPELFPEWRATFFEVEAGVAYETPKHQMAWFWCIYALTLKVRIPDWVVEYLELPSDFNDDILGMKKLITLLILAPPRHGKTELMLHALIYIFMKYPNLRIIYCSGIKTTSEDNIDMVRGELETNEKLIKAYGPFTDGSNRWSRQGFTLLTRTVVRKTTTMHPVGKGSNVLSKDADVIVLDDPQELDDADSETQTDRDFRWLTTNLGSRREPKTPLFGIGSHQPSELGDLWSRVEDWAEGQQTNSAARTVIVKMKAHDYEKCDPVDDPAHERCVLWPGKRDFWFLEAFRESLGDLLFEVCFNQESRLGRTLYFTPEVIRGEYFEPYPDLNNQVPLLDPGTEVGVLDRSRSFKQIPNHCGKRVLVTMGFDPASSEAKRASYSASTVLGGCPSCNRRFLIDYEAIRQSPELHPDFILGFVKSFEVQRLRIEKNAYQKALARDPRLTQEQGKLHFTIEEWTTDERKDEPLFGVPTIGRAAREGRFSIPYKEEEDHQYAEEFLRALIRWPKKPNDLPMSLWLAELSMRQLIEEYTQSTPLLEDDADLPEYLVEQRYEVNMADLRETYAGSVW